jgi:hypothetical protein
VKGLTYPSESDAPFDVFLDNRATSPEDVIANRAEGAKPQTVPLDQFFGELDDTDDAERFRNLRRVIDTTLSDTKVMRVGSRKVDVYAVGRTKGGAWAGVHTTSVET